MPFTQHRTDTAWPEGVIARYLTLAGQSLGIPELSVEIAHTSHSVYVIATCNGCGEDKSTPTWGSADNTPEEEEWRVDQVLPTAREWAQAHAEKCRAIPRPTA